MLSFKNFLLLTEGGNIQVKTSTGETVGADPINITPNNRSVVSGQIRRMLDSMHDSFYSEHSKHLFGKNKKALETGTAYSGSITHLMNPGISNDDFARAKPKVGDVDVKIPTEHFDTLHQHLQPGRRFGAYTVVGHNKTGGELHTVMKHDDGSHVQIDFERSNYEHDEPSLFDQLSHSSDWKDTQARMKGVHARQLLNAIGTDHHKFSILYGLHSREPDKEKAAAEPWEKEPKKIAETLFGSGADHTKLGSVHGLTQLIKKHIPAEQHQAIYDKLKEDMKRNKGIDNTPVLEHLKKHLSVRD